MPKTDRRRASISLMAAFQHTSYAELSQRRPECDFYIKAKRILTKRKSTLVLDIIQGKTTVAETSRQ